MGTKRPHGREPQHTRSNVRPHSPGFFRNATVLMACAGFLAFPRLTRGQAVVEVHFGYTAADLSTAAWGRLYGPSFGLGFGGDRTQFRIEYGRQNRNGGEVGEFCTFFSCVSGPFDESFFLRFVRAGLSRSVYRAGAVDLIGTVHAGFLTQSRHLQPLPAGESFDRGNKTDIGVGGILEGHMIRWGSGLAPKAWFAYERVFESLCPADGTCYTGRNHFELGLGLRWRP